MSAQCENSVSAIDAHSFALSACQPRNRTRPAERGNGAGVRGARRDRERPALGVFLRQVPPADKAAARAAPSRSRDHRRERPRRRAALSAQVELEPGGAPAAHAGREVGAMTCALSSDDREAKLAERVLGRKAQELGDVDA